MAEISSWLLSILSIVIAGVLVDLILPNGKLNGFIRAIFGFFTVAVIISPIPKLLNKEIDFSNIIYNENSTQIDQDYIIATNKKIIESLQIMVEEKLNNEGFSQVDVEIQYIIENYSYKIEKVILNLKNLVIKPNVVHINKYTEMEQIVIDCLSISKGVVEFNE